MKKFLLFLLVNYFLTIPYAFSNDRWLTVRSDLRAVVLTGFTRAKATMPLIAEVSGRVKNIFADIGEPVPNTGQFACLDKTLVDLDIHAAKSDMLRHTADISFLKKEVSRHDRLVKAQTAAVSVRDSLVRDLGKARQLYVTAEINKKRHQELKRRHCITAPVGWLVIARNIEDGQWVSAGQELGQAGHYDQLIIPLSLSFSELEALKRDKDSLKVVFPELKQQSDVTIEHISPAFDSETRKILVDLLINAKDLGVRGGMRAEITLGVDSVADSSAVLIDKRALDERYEEHWVQRRDGKRFRVKVIRQLDDGWVRILSSEIQVGDQLKIFAE